MRDASILFTFLLVLALATACEKTYVPKPKAYHRIDVPTHSYQSLEPGLPYSFQYSKHAKVAPHKSARAEPDWIDIHYPIFRATVQITYKPLYNVTNPIARSKLYYELLNDSYKLTSKHEVKASGIEERYVRTPSGRYATLFELEGDVPSQFQFIVTDTNRHFLRGVLYFRTATKNDSLKPLIEYVKIDMMHMINTLEWKN